MSSQRPAAIPTLVTLLLCDQVIDDKLSNKKSAIGIFNTILVGKLPTDIHQMVILASLTEIVGRIEVELRLVRDTDNVVIFSGSGGIEAPDPLAVVDLLFAMPGLRIADPGQYAFEMLVAGQLLGRRRFQVRLRPPMPPNPSGPADQYAPG
jgi:hypothetical protein